MTTRDMLDQENHQHSGRIPLRVVVGRIQARQAQKRRLATESIRQLLRSQVSSDCEVESDGFASLPGLVVPMDADDDGYEGDCDIVDDLSIGTNDSMVLAAERLPHLVHNPERFHHFSMPRAHKRRGKRNTRYCRKDPEQSESCDPRIYALVGRFREESLGHARLNFRFLRSQDSLVLAKKRLRGRKGHTQHSRNGEKDPPNKFQMRNIAGTTSPEVETVPRSSHASLRESPYRSFSFQRPALPMKSVSESLLYMSLSMSDGQNKDQPHRHLSHHRSLSPFTRMVLNSYPYRFGAN
jgi:hypothetical protein